MDLVLVLRQRLEQFDLEQRNLAAAAEVTKSYISHHPKTAWPFRSPSFNHGIST